MPRTKVSGIEAKIGARLRNLRLTRGISQSAFGRTIGVTFQQMQKFEKGTNRISASQLFKIAEEFDVSVEYFAPKPLSKSVPRPAHGVGDKDAENALLFAQTKEGFALMRSFGRLNESTGKALVAFAQRLAEAQEKS